MSALGIGLILATVVLIVLGIISCIAPPLPGPLVSYGALWTYSFIPEVESLSTTTFIIWGVLVALVLAADFFAPVLATKKFGGTKWGIWGGAIGAIVGLFIGPYGLILGPLLGAIIGDLLGGNRIKAALKSGIGNFIGFVIATLLKVFVSVAISIVVITKAFSLLFDLF